MAIAYAREGADVLISYLPENCGGRGDRCRRHAAPELPNQLGVEYNAHAIKSILEFVAPALGWR